jgi:hypothetical protein
MSRGRQETSYGVPKRRIGRDRPVSILSVNARIGNRSSLPIKPGDATPNQRDRTRNAHP